MRPRLVHTLSLWLLATAAVSVLAMGGVTAWNLGQGFSDYLQARDAERLERFAQIVGERLQQPGAEAAWQERRPSMPGLLRELARQEGGERTGPPRAEQDLADGEPAAPGRRPGGPGRAAPGGTGGAADAFGARVALFLPDGSPWVGRPLPPGRLPLIERPVRVDGRTVALARLRLLEGVPDASEVRFLRRQYLGIGVVATLLIALALVAAWWLARQWAQPLAAVQDATARIARGELGVRLPQRRSDEIGDVERNVNRMAESLQRMEGARRRWIADMSHELRTPLAVLRGELEALLDGVRPLTREAAISLREEVLRLGGLVDDLHLLAMADLHSLPYRPADADAVEVLRGVMQRFEPRARTAGLSLAWATEPPADLPVCWDAARIEQLLGNLIENSLRYTDAPGRIAIGLQPPGAAAGSPVLITVDDSAPGVAAADLPRLFEPLYRADAARSCHTGGSGLGLAICEAIVQAHGGQVQARASALGGLQVAVTLPLQPTGAAA